MALGCLGIRQRVGERRAVHGLLLDPVDVGRHRDSRDVEDRGTDVGDVREVRPQFAGFLIESGQWTTRGLRVPPRCEPTCFPHLNGVLLAHAQAAE